MATTTDDVVEDAVDTAHDDHADHDAAGVPAAALPRGRNLQVGAAFFTAGTLMYFGALFAIYLSERLDHLRVNDALVSGGEPWIPDSVRVELTAPTMIAWTLLISIVPMQWAVYSFKRNDRRHGLIAMLVSIMFAGAVINHIVFQWKQLGMVADDVTSQAPNLIYVITASFVVSMAIALIALVLAGFRALSGASTQPHTDGVASVATYWYALVAVYFVIWLLIFVTK